MKKLLAMMLALALCLSLPVPAFATDSSADEEPEYDVCLSVDDADEGLSVVLNAVTAVTDGVVTVVYDTAAVSITEDAVVAADTVDMYSVNAEEAGTLKISWLSAEAAEGTLFTLGFVQADGASVTDETFGLGGSVVDEDNNVMTLAVVSTADATQPGGDETVDKSALQSLYDTSLTLDEEDYTAASWADLVAAQENALAVLENEEATQEQVDAALEDLAAAILGLVLVDSSSDETDKTALQELYNTSLLLSEEDYTAASWADLVTAQENALAVLEDDNATQSEVDAAWNALLDAILALTAADDAEEVNKDALLLLYEASLKLDEENYTSESWADLVTAQGSALAVLEDDNATQEEVDAALTELTNALKGLVRVTDSSTTATNKDALWAAYNSSMTLNKNNYTSSSWAALVSARDAALAVLEDDDATQEEIDAALSALLSAIEGLDAKTTVTAKDTKTGDNAPIYILTITGLAAAAAAIFLVSRKMKRSKQ